MSYSIVCWGCGLERRRTASHPVNPMDRGAPHGWRTVKILCPERWWELKFLVCGPACEAVVTAATANLKAHIEILHKKIDITPSVQDAEFEDG